MSSLQEAGIDPLFINTLHFTCFLHMIGKHQLFLDERIAEESSEYTINYFLHL